MSPLAGSKTGCGIFKIKSGFGMLQPSTKAAVAGRLSPPLQVIPLRPGHERDDLRCAERRIVRKMSNARIGEPRWHRFFLCRLADCPGEKLGLPIALERHGRNAPVAVADLAMLLENRQHLPIKGSWSSGMLSRTGIPDWPTWANSEKHPNR